MINAELTLIDWLSSLIPLRFPTIKIALSEGGIGWVPALLDRLDRNFHHLPIMRWSHRGPLSEMLPSEVVKRNFWFCAIDEPLGFQMLELIGADNVLVESDYPHNDSSWPDTQAVLNGQINGLASEVREAITWQNACELFRHSLD
jgi:hypothetical protein